MTGSRNNGLSCVLGGMKRQLINKFLNSYTLLILVIVEFLKIIQEMRQQWYFKKLYMFDRLGPERMDCLAFEMVLDGKKLINNFTNK